MRRRALPTRAFTLLATVAVALAVSPVSGRAWKGRGPGLEQPVVLTPADHEHGPTDVQFMDRGGPATLWRIALLPGDQPVFVGKRVVLEQPEALAEAWWQGGVEVSEIFRVSKSPGHR